MQAVPYVKTEDFTDYATDNPQAPYPPAKIDNQLADVARFSSEIQGNLFKLQRDDGALRNGVVTPSALSESLILMLNSEFTPKGHWTTGVSYKTKDLLENTSTNELTVVVSDHVSGVYATDKSTAKLIVIGKIVEQATNSEVVTYNPSGNAVLTTQSTVQGAIDGVDTELATLRTVNVAQAQTNVETQNQVGTIQEAITNLQNEDAGIKQRLDAGAVDANITVFVANTESGTAATKTLPFVALRQVKGGNAAASGNITIEASQDAAGLYEFDLWGLVTNNSVNANHSLAFIINGQDQTNNVLQVIQVARTGFGSTTTGGTSVSANGFFYYKYLLFLNDSDVLRVDTLNISTNAGILFTVLLKKVAN